MEKQSLLAEYVYDKLVSQAMVKFDIIGASYKTKYKVFFFLLQRQTISSLICFGHKVNNSHKNNRSTTIGGSKGGVMIPFHARIFYNASRTLASRIWKGKI